MCVSCNSIPRCRTCGDFIDTSDLDFTESIDDEGIVSGIVNQKKVCNCCKLDQITTAERSKLGFYHSFGMRSAGTEN